MKLAPFEPSDLDELLEIGGDAFASSRPVLSQPGYGDLLKSSGPAWSVFDDDFQLIGCGGTAEEHAGCATAWSLLNPNLSGRHMVLLTRVARRVIAACPKRRIQAHALPDFLPAARWLQLLGFQYEGRLRCYAPDGSDMNLFALVK